MKCLHDHSCASREPVTLHAGELEDPSSCFTFASAGECSVTAQKWGWLKTLQRLPVSTRMTANDVTVTYESPLILRSHSSCSHFIHSASSILELFLNGPGSFRIRTFPPTVLSTSLSPSPLLEPLLITVTVRLPLTTSFTIVTLPQP